MAGGPLHEALLWTSDSDREEWIARQVLGWAEGEHLVPHQTSFTHCPTSMSKSPDFDLCIQDQPSAQIEITRVPWGHSQEEYATQRSWLQRVGKALQGKLPVAILLHSLLDGRKQARRLAPVVAAGHIEKEIKPWIGQGRGIVQYGVIGGPIMVSWQLTASRSAGSVEVLVGHFGEFTEARFSEFFRSAVVEAQQKFSSRPTLAGWLVLDHLHASHDHSEHMRQIALDQVQMHGINLPPADRMHAFLGSVSRVLVVRTRPVGNRHCRITTTEILP